MEEPFACHPSFTQGYYDRDNAFYLAWDAIARDAASLDAWLDEWVYGLANHAEYVEKMGAQLWDRAAAGSGHVRRGRLRAVRVSDAAATDLGYTKSEIMIAASARQLDAVRNCFVGVGLPNIVCNLAQRTVSPDLQLVYESGVFGARPERLPLSIGDPTLVTGATAVTSMFELFAYYLQAGLIDVAFLGAAQIDRFGNINTTVIGDYDHPKVRLPGSGGACEIAINARQVMVIMRQGTRSFVDTIDFRTSPGHSRGSGARRGARLVGQRSHERGDGPGHVRVRRSTGEMTLTTLHPGVTLEQVRDNMGWEPRVADGLGETPAPSDEELRLIREELDPAASTPSSAGRYRTDHAGARPRNGALPVGRSRGDEGARAGLGQGDPRPAQGQG